MDWGDVFLFDMDVVLVFATGSGKLKTLAFLQSLLSDATNKPKLVTISPLNKL
jgi:hypothetical protein